MGSVLSLLKSYAFLLQHFFEAASESALSATRQEKRQVLKLMIGVSPLIKGKVAVHSDGQAVCLARYT